MILDKSTGAASFIIDEMASKLSMSREAFLKAYMVTTHTIEAWKYLNPTESKYTFSLNEGVDPLIPGEIKLNKNAWFGSIGISLVFKKCDYAAATTTYSNHGNYGIHTWPSPQYFNGPAAAPGNKTEWQNLLTVVEGTISMRAGTADVLNQLKSRELFLQNVNSETLSPLDHQQYGPTIDERGFFQPVPHFILDGGQDNTFTVDLANGDRTLIDGANNPLTNTRNMIGVRLFGLIVRNTNGQACPTSRSF